MRESEGTMFSEPIQPSATPDSPPAPGLLLIPPRRISLPVPVRSKRFSDRLARFGDLALVLMLLALTLPLMLAIALAIRYEGSGPILEWQQRIGSDGRVVNALRFRTTHAPVAETQWLRRTHRTSLGAVLWRTHLDAIPMLINVLRGEMTIIGLSGRARLLG